MKIKLEYNDEIYTADLSKPIDISIKCGDVRCFYAPDFVKKPMKSGDFIGSIKHGAPVNFYNIELNPHGNGTHTECIGHITETQESLDDVLREYHFISALVSVQLQHNEQGDQYIDLDTLQNALPNNVPPAIIIRTMPNYLGKKNTDYSGKNPPYIAAEAMDLLVRYDVKHLLVDLPSVDREKDDGLLSAHKKFWGIDAEKNEGRSEATITELVFVEDQIEDGIYLLNIQVSSIPLDAVPSKPVLYKLTQVKALGKTN